ncbi:MAG: protein kinase [Candidatus Melainabacteria bacterium]|nr:protein kinase [Candidatus Melainabacteria bacterium]
MGFDKLMDQDNSLNSKLSIAEEAFLQCPNCKALYARNIAYCTADGTRLEDADATGTSGSIFAGKYEILGEIGSGGMGTVYRVRQILLDKVCALKVIPAQSLNDLSITRFQREAKMMATLDHANLSRIIDFGIYRNQPFMVMEFIDGIPLSKLILESQISIEETIDIFAQVLDALSHAHKKGVLHRDIKPSNIMIVQTTPVPQNKNCYDRKAILLDFGIAKTIDTTADTEIDNVKIQALTRTGEMIGSPLYMSPEQAHGDKLTERSDLYSLGCALFESLAGTAPFVGNSQVDTLILHMEQPPPTLKEASLGREFPAALERVVRKLLSKDPGERYQSAEETKRALMLALSLDSGTDAVLPDQSGRTGTRATMLLIAVSLIATVSIITYLTLQGEKNARSADRVLEEDQIKIEKTVLSVADAQLLGTRKKNRDTESDDEDAAAQYEQSEKSRLNLTGNETVLALRRKNIGDIDAKLIEQNKQLDRIGLAEAKFDHKMLGRLSGSLKSLRLAETGMKDDEMRYVAKNTALVKLVLNANPISSKGIRHLASMNSLRFLDLANTRCDAAAIYELRNLSNLQALHLNNNDRMDDKAAEAVSFLSGLQELTLDHTSITGEGIAYLRRLRGLSKLTLDGLNLQDNDIASLKDISSLKVLSLSHNKITAAGLKSLTQLKQLSSLYLDFNPIDDKGVDYLLQIPSLVNLSVSGTKLKPAGVMKLAELHNLRSIYVRRLQGVNDQVAYDFLSRSKSCQRFTFLREKNAGYGRAEWQLDEKSNLYTKKNNQQNGE